MRLVKATAPDVREAPRNEKALPAGQRLRKSRARLDQRRLAVPEHAMPFLPGTITAAHQAQGAQPGDERNLDKRGIK